ncbi:major tail protein [Caryophanon tenue]|uniref:Phage tail protein n=1 Tax=Caryophanon tenue TaxID=33978 RepID=A0A1C0Y517_9BACL|nr:major tail protein [Caryophanon tenue]OCS82279.1 phage tail protein [Caryophanon tenue]
MAENKVMFGLQDVHFSVITKGTDGTYTYATPKRITGAVSLELSALGETTPFYADNGVYYATSTNNGYEGTLTIANLTEEFRTEVLGEVLVNGGLLEKGDAKTKDIALLYQIEGDEQASRMVLYDVAVARPSISTTTKGESTEVNTNELTFSAKPRTSDRAIKWATGSATPKSVYDSFYTAVVEPVEIPSV